jgi:hypothetical protein
MSQEILKLVEKSHDGLVPKVRAVLDRSSDTPLDVMAGCIVAMAYNGSSPEDVELLDGVFEQFGLHGFRAVFEESKKILF